MHALTRQLKAAQAQYDSLSPPEPDDRDPSDAVAAIADRDIANWNVGEVYEDLYGEGQVAGALDRLMCGTRAQFGDERLLQNLRRRLLALESAVESEMSA